jgi:uroporphyrin-3 C-methyltransferase
MEPTLGATREESTQAERGEPDAPHPSAGAKWLTVLAIALAVSALAASAWQWTESLALQRDLANLSGTDSAQSSRFEQSLAELQRELDRVEAGRAALESSRQDTFNDLAKLTQRLAAMEQSVASLQGMPTQTRDHWIRAEVEYLLGIANARLQLARDVPTAATALRLADSRLSGLDDPAFLEVRREIRRELMELDGVAIPDTQGIALTLGNLAASVAKFPLARRGNTGQETSGKPEAAEQSGWDRAVSSVSHAMRDLVNVRKSDEPVTPLLSPAEEYFLLRNLELKLEASRLALLTGDETSYRESLRSARRWLGTHFDVSDNSVSSAIDTLADLEMRNIHPALPDISNSLRQLRNLAEQAAPGTP